jgi:alkylated DNA nucleotide flippase Atl1
MTSSLTFSQKVVKLALTIPPGRVTTYALIAVAAGGHPRMAQMITYILGKSKDSVLVPYHRIVYSDGRVWLDPTDPQSRLHLYEKEGIRLDSKLRIVGFENVLYVPNLK